jgi:hypothetical protein
MGHVHSAGSARVRTARGPWLAGSASACASHDCTALRVSAQRSDHRSPGARRGAAVGGATMAEVEQGKALEHPRRRGHPPGMWVEAVAHRSFLPREGGKTRSAVAAFSDEVRAPAVGGGPTSGWRGRGSSAQQSPEKKQQGGARAPLTVEGFATAEAVGQRRWRARAGARRSDGDVVCFGHGRWCGRDGAREMRRGEATLPLTTGPHSSAFSVLKITPGQK